MGSWPRLEVVVRNGAQSLRVGDGGVRRAAQVHEERFAWLGRRVAPDRDGDGGRAVASSDGRGARRAVVVAACDGRSVCGRVVDADVLTARGGQRNREGRDLITSGTFGNRDVVDAQGRRRVVVGDRTETLRIS